MPDAHEAAVEAMAAALDERFTSGVNPHEWDETAQVALTALVRSEAVRAALVEVHADHACPRSEVCADGHAARRKVGAILAALGGPYNPTERTPSA